MTEIARLIASAPEHVPDPAQTNGVGDPPAFPIETLPGPFGAFVEAAARSVVCPPDFAAVPLLVAAGAAIGNALELVLKHGWKEGPNLYAAWVGNPGTKKSPGADPSLAPLMAIQTEEARSYDGQRADYERDLSTWENLPKQDRGQKPVAPTFPHLFTTDSTTEALVLMLAQSKGLLLHRDELVGWVKSMDQYRSGKGADRQNFLSAWSRKPIKVDRARRDTQFVPRPSLSVCGGIQPDLLPDLADAANREDGFVDRLLWAYPEPVADRWSDDTIPLQLEAQVHAIFLELYRLSPGEDGLPIQVRLSDEAKAVWTDWYDDHSRQQPERALRGSWAKMPSQAGRLALIAHAVRAVSRECNLTLMEDRSVVSAVAQIEDYFKPHARRVYGLLIKEKGIAARGLAYIEKCDGRASEWALYTDCFHNNVAADQIRDELGDYVESGVLGTEQVAGSATGRPTTWWFLRHHVSTSEAPANE